MTGEAAEPPPRVLVHVTRPPVPRPTAGATHDIAEQTELGAVLLQSLLHAQLRLAIRVMAVVVVLVGGVPLSFALAPGLWSEQVLGVPVALLVVGVGAYPVLLVAGWLFVRRAERNEADFVAVVERS